MGKHSDFVDIHFHLEKAKAQYKKKANPLSNKFLRHLANAINTDPNNKELQAFLENIRHKMKPKARSIFDKKLNGILAIQSSFRDKGVSSTSAFEAKGKKTAGVTAGYIAKETASGHTFMIKEFYKKTPKKRFDNSRSDAIREFIGSAIYSLLLYDRSPKIALTTSSEDSDKLYIRSKFLSQVESLKDSTGGAGRSHYIDPRYFEPVPGSLNGVEGFEKVIAACTIMGDPDYHTENVMVQNKKTMTKIDHGKSLTTFPENFEEFLFQLAMNFDYFKYSKAIKSGTLQFNLQEYINTLNQMLSQLTDDQIDLLIDKKIDELKKAGLEIEGLKMHFSHGSTKQSIESFTGDKAFDDLKLTMKSQLKTHVNNMRLFSTKLQKMANAPGKDERYLNGGWLTELSKPMGLSGILIRFLESIAERLDLAFSSPLTRNTSNKLLNIAASFKEANFNRRLVRALDLEEQRLPEQFNTAVSEDNIKIAQKPGLTTQANLLKSVDSSKVSPEASQEPPASKKKLT